MVDISNAVTTGLTQAAGNANNELTQKDVAAVSKTVSAEVQKETDAVIENITNQEPLWQSRNFWTALVTIAASVAGLAGYAYSVEDQATTVDGITSIVTAAAGLFMLVNRILAGRLKPIGK